MNGNNTESGNSAPVATREGVKMNVICSVRDCPNEATTALVTSNYLNGVLVCAYHEGRHAKVVTCMDADKKELDTFNNKEVPQ